MTDDPGPRREHHRPRRWSVIDWLFRNRTTGRITVAQMPNIPAWVFIIAAFLRAVIGPDTTAGTVLDVIASVALAVWAVDEAARGVNPFRRFLGAAVLAFQVAWLVLR